MILRVENEETSHYTYIKHIERLFNLHHQGCDEDKKILSNLSM